MSVVKNKAQQDAAAKLAATIARPNSGAVTGPTNNASKAKALAANKFGNKLVGAAKPNPAPVMPALDSTKNVTSMGTDSAAFKSGERNVRKGRGIGSTGYDVSRGAKQR